MKALLLITLAGSAVLGMAGYSARKAAAILTPADGGSFALGLRALSGELLKERLAELEKGVSTPAPPAGVLRPTADLPPICSEPVLGPINARTAAQPRPVLVEAWGHDGRIYCRDTQNRVYERLAGGELAEIFTPP